MGGCGCGDMVKETRQGEGICNQMRLELSGIFKGDKVEIGYNLWKGERDLYTFYVKRSMGKIIRNLSCYNQ